MTLTSSGNVKLTGKVNQSAQHLLNNFFFWGGVERKKKIRWRLKLLATRGGAFDCSHSRFTCTPYNKSRDISVKTARIRYYALPATAVRRSCSFSILSLPLFCVLLISKKKGGWEEKGRSLTLWLWMVLRVA